MIYRAPQVLLVLQDFPGSSDGKASTYNAGDPDSIPGSGRSPGEGNGNQLQYSCLENPMDLGAWWATIHGVAKSWTRQRDFTSLHFQLLLVVKNSPANAGDIRDTGAIPGLGRSPEGGHGSPM